jgi:hypothetical protein
LIKYLVVSDKFDVLADSDSLGIAEEAALDVSQDTEDRIGIYQLNSEVKKVPEIRKVKDQ